MRQCHALIAKAGVKGLQRVDVVADAQRDRSEEAIELMHAANRYNPIRPPLHEF